MCTTAGRSPNLQTSGCPPMVSGVATVEGLLEGDPKL